MAFGVPAYLTNDANAAAIGEHMFGNARNVKDFIIITLGTGLGSGIFANGQLVYGNDGFAGELGHILIDGNERMCGCGRKGCLETYASATGLKRTVVQLLDEKEIKSSLYDIPVNTLSARMIEKAAREGDPLALEAFEITGKVLGKALANAVAFTSPALIVLFGGLSQARELLLNPTKREMEENLLRIYKSKVPIIFSGLPGNDAALLGAAALAWKELGVE
jgi:glucokinase